MLLRGRFEDPLVPVDPARAALERIMARRWTGDPGRRKKRGPVIRGGWHEAVELYAQRFRVSPRTAQRHINRVLREEQLPLSIADAVCVLAGSQLDYEYIGTELEEDAT